MQPYVTADTLKTVATADDESPTSVWESLAQSVSRLFDRECQVTDGFFLAASDTPTAKTFRGDGTNYLAILPHQDDITAVSVDDVALTLPSTDFYEHDGYLIFTYDIEKTSTVDITAKWGFESVAKDIEYACIEQALFMWRRKDLTFTALAGVSTAAVAAEFSPTFKAIAARYRAIYGQFSYFA